MSQSGQGCVVELMPEAAGSQRHRDLSRRTEHVDDYGDERRSRLMWLWRAIKVCQQLDDAGAANLMGMVTELLPCISAPGREAIKFCALDCTDFVESFSVVNSLDQEIYICSKMTVSSGTLNTI